MWPVRAQKEVGVLAVSSRQNLCVLLLPPSSPPAATVFAIRKRSSPLPLLLSAACQKTKMLLLFTQVEKSRKSICLPVRQKNSPEAGERERGRGGIIPCHATPSHLYLSPPSLVLLRGMHL